jgi:hypothetical protein
MQDRIPRKDKAFWLKADARTPPAPPTDALPSAQERRGQQRQQ